MYDAYEIKYISLELIKLIYSANIFQLFDNPTVVPEILILLSYSSVLQI